jgi:hypothetical protein
MRDDVPSESPRRTEGQLVPDPRKAERDEARTVWQLTDNRTTIVDVTIVTADDVNRLSKCRIAGD